MFFKLFPYKKVYSLLRLTLVISVLLVIFSLFNSLRGNGRKISYAGPVSGENYDNLDKDSIKFELEIRADEAKIRPGLGDLGKAVILSGMDKAKSAASAKKWAMSVYLSDLISYNRSLADYRNPSCKHVVYDAELPSVSVIVIFHNEPYSVVVRTVWSVLNSARRSNPVYRDANFKDGKSGAEMKLGYPGQDIHSEFVYLKEIVLVDDASTLPELQGKLDHYISTRLPANMVKIVRLPSRIGLTRARLRGAKISMSDVCIFLDAHCEGNEDWIRPLLQRIKEKRNAVAVPEIDPLNERTLAYEQGYETIEVGGFNFAGHFTWIDVSQREKLRRGSEISPTWSPTMAGGLFAVNRKYFWEIGSYDEQMNGWGGENLEISFRVWQCGGTLETIPCSRVGHVFRNFHPYAFPGNSDTHGINTARMAEVWMDEYKELYYLNRPDLRKSPKIGDVTHRKVLREKLQCRSFQWYLDNIYPEKFIPVKDVVGFGRISNPATGLCLDTLQHEESPSPLGAYACHSSLAPTQYFALTRQGQLRNEETCAHVRYSREAEIRGDGEGRKVYLSTCKRKRNDDQKWKITSTGEIRSSSGFRLCLDASGLDNGGNFMARPCNDEDTQKWILEYNEHNDYGFKGKNATSDRAQNFARIRNSGKTRRTRDLLSVQNDDDYTEFDHPKLARLGTEVVKKNNSLPHAHKKKHKHNSRHTKKHNNHHGRKFLNGTDHRPLERGTNLSKTKRRSEIDNESNRLLLMIKRDGDGSNMSDILELELKPVNRSMKLNNNFVYDLVKILNENDVRVFVNNTMFKDLVVGTERRAGSNENVGIVNKNEEVQHSEEQVNEKPEKNKKFEKSLKERIFRLILRKNKLTNKDIAIHAHLVKPISNRNKNIDTLQDDNNINKNESSMRVDLYTNKRENDKSSEDSDERLKKQKNAIFIKRKDMELKNDDEENEEMEVAKADSETTPKKIKESEISFENSLERDVEKTKSNQDTDITKPNSGIFIGKVKEEGEISSENKLKKKTKKQLKLNKKIMKKNDQSVIKKHDSKISQGKIEEDEASLKNNLEKSRKKVTQLDILKKEWKQLEEMKNIERTKKENAEVKQKKKKRPSLKARKKKGKKSKNHDGIHKTLYKYKAKPTSYEEPYVGESVEYRDEGQREDKLLRRTEDDNVQTVDVPALNHIIIKNKDLMRRKHHQNTKNDLEDDEMLEDDPKDRVAQNVVDTSDNKSKQVMDMSESPKDDHRKNKEDTVDDKSNQILDKSERRKYDENVEDDKKDSASQNKQETLEDKSNQVVDKSETRKDLEIHDVDEKLEGSGHTDSNEEVEYSKVINIEENKNINNNKSRESKDVRRNKVEIITKKPHFHRKNKNKVNETKPPTNIDVVTTEKISLDSVSYSEDNENNNQSHSSSNESHSVENKTNLSEKGEDADVGSHATTGRAHSLRKSDSGDIYDSPENLYRDMSFRNLPVKSFRKSDFIGNERVKNNHKRNSKSNNNNKILTELNSNEKNTVNGNNTRKFKNAKHKKKIHKNDKFSHNYKTKKTKRIAHLVKEAFASNKTRRFNKKYRDFEPVFYRRGDHSEEYARGNEKLDFESRANRMDDLNDSDIDYRH